MSETPVARPLRTGLAVAALVGAAVLIGLAAGPAPALAGGRVPDDAGGDKPGSGADSSSAGSDSTVAGADSSGAGSDSTGTGSGKGPGRGPGRGLAEPPADKRFWVVHPTYSIKINKRQDVTNYDSQIGLSKTLSDKITLNLNGILATRENTTLNRSDATNTANAGLRYGLNENINFNMNYNTNVSAFSYDLKGGAPANLKKGENLTISGDLNKEILDAISVVVKASAGSTANSFSSVSNTGRKEDLSAVVSFSPADRLHVSANYSGNRLFLDSKVDSGQGVVFSSEDKTFAENLTFNMIYDMVPGIRITFDASEGESQRQHPDPDQKEQETEKKHNKNAVLTSSFSGLTWLTGDLAVVLDDSRSEYVIRSRSNRRTTAAQLKGNARISGWRGATVTLGGAHDVSRDVFTSADTGDDTHRSLNFKLAQNLGPKADASLTAISDLTRVAYDDKAANPKDRDRLSNRILLDLTYNPTSNVSTRLGGEYGNEQAIYVKAASSANNRATTRYRVTGTYDVNTFHNIAIEQTYEIGAVYSLYEFDEANNALVRNSNVSTSFDVPVIPGVKLRIDHAYRYQDQGSYEEDSRGGHYGRSAASESNTLSLASGFIIKKIRLYVTQSYYAQDNWTYKDGKKVFKPKVWSTDISGRASISYRYMERTIFSFSLERSLKEGTNVPKAAKEFWNIELEASHVF
jgi:hypothetical protein